MSLSNILYVYFMLHILYRCKKKKNFGELSASWYTLSNAKEFVWNEEHQFSFDKLNDLVVSAAILAHLTPDGFVDLLCFSVLCLLCMCMRLFTCALWSPAGKALISWLSFLVSSFEFVTFPLASWVRCGTCLYRFLILHPYLLCLY